MKKNVHVRINFKKTISTPTTVSIEELADYEDEEVEKRITQLINERDRAVSNGIDSRPWEEEICYAQRELRTRRSRRFAHDKYVRNNPELYTAFFVELNEDIEKTLN